MTEDADAALAAQWEEEATLTCASVNHREVWLVHLTNAQDFEMPNGALGPQAQRA